LYEPYRVSIRIGGKASEVTRRLSGLEEINARIPTQVARAKIRVKEQPPPKIADIIKPAIRPIGSWYNREVEKLRNRIAKPPLVAREMGPAVGECKTTTFGIPGGTTYVGV